MAGYLAAARALHYASTISLAGVFAFLCLVAGRQVSTRLVRRLSLVAWISLGLALCSGGAWLVCVSAQMSGEPVAAALRQGVIPTVLADTRFGQVWIVRFALAVILVLLLLSPGQWRRMGWRWSGFAVAASMLASLAWAGHGAATPGAPGNLHLTADLLHLLAAGVWVGALIPLALLLAEVKPSGDPGASAAARYALVRFSIVAATSVVILFVAGLVNTWFLAGSVPALIGTEYGRLLLAKIAIFLTMVVFGAVNLLRMAPRVVPATAEGALRQFAALRHLRRNALVEAGLGLAVLCIVAVLGILPPGLHTEPGWPLPFRLEIAALGSGAVEALAIFGLLVAIFAVGAVATAAAGRYRAMALAAVGVSLCGAVCIFIAAPAIAPAYPTTFFTPAEPYAAISVQRGARLYTEYCALCHGADGKGDGSAAAALPIRPANLVASHLFAHTPGDLFWWVGHGKGKGAMPGFAGTLDAADRWDVINFVRARAAAVLSMQLGSTISTVAALPVPDFAFMTRGGQQTLRTVLKTRPVLIALFASPPPRVRLGQLAGARTQKPPLEVIAVDLTSTAAAQSETFAASPVVDVTPTAAAVLGMFRAPTDRGETDLLLDRAGNIRARWSANRAEGVADPAALIADAARVVEFSAAPETHAGHSQ